ncbi:shikimate dehydrogenase [Aquifex sp.]
MINSSTELYGVIGYPIRHSLSPIFQNALLEYAGLNGVYLAFEVKPEELGKALQGFKAIGVKGINVTIPHKEAIMEHLDEIDPVAREIGAVNTVKFENGRAAGYNTDWIGFLKALRMLVPSVEGEKVLVLGAGGASKAVVYALLQAGAEVFLWNRTREKALNLVKKFGNRLTAVNKPEEIIKETRIIVNTTSVGLREDDPEIFDYSLITPEHMVVDIIYKETKLIKRAKEVGAKHQDGLPMLLWQGIESFKIWNGCEVPYSVALRAVENYLNAKVY